MDFDGVFLDGQTLYRRDESSILSTEAWISDGVLHARGLELTLNMDIEGMLIKMPLHNVSVRGTLEETGEMTGYFGGVSDVDVFLFFTMLADAGFFDYLADRIYQNADMEPDESGFCHQISSSFDFAAVPAYVR